MLRALVYLMLALACMSHHVSREPVKELSLEMPQKSGRETLSAERHLLGTSDMHVEGSLNATDEQVGCQLWPGRKANAGPDRHVARPKHKKTRRTAELSR